jgi:hypothetical protein
MKVRHAVLTCAGVIALASCSESSAGPGPLPSCGAHGTQLSLAVGAYTSINPASDSGCVTFAANSAADTAEYLVLPWSTGGTGSSAPFMLQSASPVASISMSRALAPAAPSSRGATAAAFDHFLRELASNRRYTMTDRSATVVASAVPRPSPAGPPTVGNARTFKVCANMSCSTLNNVGAVARAVGAHIAIYIDTLAPSPGLSAGDLDSLKNVFDSRLYPLDTLTFGHVSDIDSNTVVIVLMSNQVNKLVTAAECNRPGGGYIAGFFFPGDLAPGFSTSYNNGEIFYSIVADSTGSLSCVHKNSEVNNVTPVTFTHEFQHMINFVEHVLVRNANRSEEGWLDEGLSKYAEEIAGRSYLADADTAMFSNYAIGAVYDGYQYLLATGDTPLLIPADNGTLAMVGASWLFTRYIVDQFGDSLPGRLVRTMLTGAANVAGQTGQPFDQTVSRWALANWVDDLPGFLAPSELRYSSWNFRHTFSSLHSQDAHNFPLAYPLVPTLSAGNAVNVSGTLRSGSGEYVRAVQGRGGAEFTLHFGANGTTAVSPAVIPRLVVLRIR